MIDEFRPLVAEELEYETGATIHVLLSDDIERLAQVGYNTEVAYMQLHRSLFNQELHVQRAVIVHELSHVCTPPSMPFAISEGLADLVTVRLVPESEHRIWGEHWSALIDTEMHPSVLLLDGPTNDEEEDSLRAYGFFAALHIADRYGMNAIVSMSTEMVVTETLPSMELALHAATLLHPGP